MPENTIPVLHPSYHLSVLCAYFAAKAASGYEAVQAVESIKSIGKADQKAEQTVYASGITYNYTSRKTGTQLTLGVVALPTEMVRQISGKQVSTKGGFAFVTSADDGGEFAYGQAYENSDNTQCFEWFPRCKLVTADQTKNTSTAQAEDPSESYVILAMPTADKLISVEYDQRTVTEGMTPLTAEQFFAHVIASKDDPTIDSEEAAGA